jgi:hypothetical protein
LILLGGALGVVLPGQTRDMLAALADGPSWGAISFQISLLFLAGSAWFWSRAALAARLGIPDRSLVSPRPDRRANWRAFAWLPRLILAASFLTGVVVAWRSTRYVAMGGAACLGGVALLLAIKRRTLMARFPSATPPNTSGAGGLSRVADLLRYAPFGPRVAAPLLGAGCSILLLGIVETFTAALHLPRIFALAWPGPAVALMLLGLMIGPLTVLTCVTDRFDLRRRLRGFGPRRPPILTALVLYIFVIVPEFFDVHMVRLIPPSQPLAKMPLPTLVASWVETCQPGDGAIRPVIVAVSGGATRAALWGAAVIDQVLQADQKSGAALFAISSVSGGSLGTAAALSLVAQDALPCQAADLSKLRPGKEGVPLAGDALGPLLAGWLVDDIPSAGFEPLAYAVRAVTGGHSRGVDSAAALETAFDDLWSRVDDDPRRSWEMPFLSLFYDKDGKYKAGMPLWFANGTDAGNGNRVITSPIMAVGDTAPHTTSKSHPDLRCSVTKSGDWDDDPACPSSTWPFRGARDFHALMHADVAISTAIDNTSRFPFLEPYGQMLPYDISEHFLCHFMRHVDCPEVASLIDGGYFENEGLQTALDLAEFLVREGDVVHGRRVEPIIVEATGNGEDDAEQVMTCDHPSDAPSLADIAHGPWQIFAPFSGLYHVRGGHSAVLLRQAHDEFCPSGRFAHFYLAEIDHANVPLNWVLSSTLAEKIWEAAGKDNPLSSKEIVRLRAVSTGGAGASAKPPVSDEPSSQSSRAAGSAPSGAD